MERTHGLTGTQLKLIAIVCMTIDHAALLFLPADSALSFLLRSIGRMTAPIMSFLLAEGVRHTHDLWRYLKRMLVFAAIAPARCAALPAAARIAPKPFSRADIAKARASSGVLWAENTWTSVGTLNSCSVVIAFSTMGRSLSLPIMTATLFKLTSLPKMRRGADEM